MTRRIPTPEELRNASDWLIYEYWMLEGLNHLLLYEEGLTEIGIVRNAVLDSFLIHARALVDFFFNSEPNHEQDAVAGDYFDETEKACWEKRHPKDPDWFKDTRTRINKGVAHISYDRNKDAWGHLLIEPEIGNAFCEFVERVPLELLGTRWERIKYNIQAGSESPVELPPFLVKGGVLKTSYYPLPIPDWYPDKSEDD
jgi:hypothetical protein